MLQSIHDSSHETAAYSSIHTSAPDTTIILYACVDGHHATSNASPPSSSTRSTKVVTSTPQKNTLHCSCVYLYVSPIYDARSAVCGCFGALATVVITIHPRVRKLHRTTIVKDIYRLYANGVHHHAPGHPPKCPNQTVLHAATGGLT
jgi:hypothetical protein